MLKKLHFLVLIGLALFTQLPAQTLKNIYRHNLPVLRIPTALIDKVETAEIDGQRTMRVIQFNGFVSQIPVVQIDSITHTDGTALDPSQLGNLRTASVMGVVRGPTGAPEMNAIVRSPYGGEETRTDPNGVFFLNNIMVYDKLGYISITKPGFHQASRSFLPLESGSNRVNVQLLTMTQSGTFSAMAGGTVTSGLLQLTFPANAIQLNGQPYSGTVRVFAAALDPTSPIMYDQMPGELLGGMNDSLRLLRSFGMASIELRDDNMNELHLANGVSATLTFNIPTDLQAEAPATIDWWSFDELLGYWKHEGEAQKQGTQYIGAASHFSWWNCDRPENFNDFHGAVNTVGGTPVSDAQINVISPTLGTGVIYTNAEGTFTCRVPKNQNLTLNVNLTCSSTNDWALAHTETIASSTQPLNNLITASLSGRYPIAGTVLNCVGQPVDSGYVKMGPQIFITQYGSFNIQTCSLGEYVIRGYNITNLDSIKVSEMITLQVDSTGANAENITTCSTMFGAVADVDGNIYETVLIGDQWWMAENLKTAHFTDGSEIPNVTTNLAWNQLTTPAWCNYNNSVTNDSIYGKLYNWFTTVDSRNVCPTGWHVPTDAEWIILRDYLGAIGQGVKMKTVNGWGLSNSLATNESGFSALPGGIFSNIDANFINAGYFGNFWSSTEYFLLTDNAWLRSMNYLNGNVTRVDYNKRNGISIRCIKD